MLRPTRRRSALARPRAYRGRRLRPRAGARLGCCLRVCRDGVQQKSTYARARLNGGGPRPECRCGSAANSLSLTHSLSNSVELFLNGFRE
jgi:hypothetical protein